MRVKPTHYGNKNERKNMKHKWTRNQTYGVQSGSGRPHGVDEFWTCAVCGARKGRGPQSTHTGQRVIRWSYSDAHGNRVDSLPSCLGYNPQAE